MQHARAESRGFDWEKDAHLKIKDHPEIFLGESGGQHGLIRSTPSHRKSFFDSQNLRQMNASLRCQALSMLTQTEEALC